MTVTVTWLSDPPEKCDTCSTEITTTFYDSQTVFRRWGHLCPSCFHLGPGLGVLGVGYGQEYKKQADGKFVKTAG